MHSMTRTWATLTLTALMLYACGGSGGGSSTSTYTPPPTPLPAVGYGATLLVTDMAGGPNHDANLVNGWGIAFNPKGYVWVANNGTSTSTLYDGNGVPQTLVVALPAGAGGSAAPTGIVFNGSSTDFKITQGGVTAASPFIFVGEGGTVSGWAPSVNLNNAVTAYDGSATGDAYKGATLASAAGAQRLFVADFHNATVAVFDTAFNKLGSGGFKDPNLPAGFAPFGIQAVDSVIYVAYAKQDAQAHDAVGGAGLGIVDAYDANGVLLKRLITGGALNAPWGMAMAPANFGLYSNALLVGNFGDGKINAFDPATGAYLGTLSSTDGKPIVIDGLWGIAFGNGLFSQPTNTLFYAAGPNDESHGIYGRIDVK